MNSLIASASRMGIVAPLFIDVMSIPRLVRPEIKKLKSLQEKNTEAKGNMDDRHYMWVSQCPLGATSTQSLVNKPIRDIISRPKSQNLNKMLITRPSECSSSFALQI